MIRKIIIYIPGEMAQESGELSHIREKLRTAGFDVERTIVVYHGPPEEYSKKRLFDLLRKKVGDGDIAAIGTTDVSAICETSDLVATFLQAAKFEDYQVATYD